jgi:hypothetical protein
MIDLKIGEYYTYKTGRFKRYNEEDIRQNPWLRMEDEKPRKLLSFYIDNSMPDHFSCCFEDIESSNMSYIFVKEYLQKYSFLKEKIDKILE